MDHVLKVLIEFITVFVLFYVFRFFLVVRHAGS